MTRKVSTYTKIKAAQRENERTILRLVKDAEKKGKLYQFPFLASHSWYNAMERLVEKGRIRFVRARSAVGRSGYKIVRAS